jgi:hypothetical protein
MKTNKIEKKRKKSVIFTLSAMKDIFATIIFHYTLLLLLKDRIEPIYIKQNFFFEIC